MTEESIMDESVVKSEKRTQVNDETNDLPRNKKMRLGFSCNDFRKKLQDDRKLTALNEFLQLITSNAKEKHILTYLKHGGSPLEILQTVNGESGAPPVLVFEVFNHILLEIIVKFNDFQSAAYDASRYLLNTLLPQINKMLGLSSSIKDRVTVLKLLTTMVTFSATLAKDILLHVNFNPTNLELITKVESKNEARAAFIHFLVAFLVDGHFTSLSVLLEKRGLMTCIVRGLQFDKVDVVVLVLTAMKDHILGNSSVSKTLKMKTFNTLVVKDIVNLYNWKGPVGLAKNKSDVDEIEKTKVNEAVHAFLIILCTSHKFGVIFKDPNLGLAKNQNTLIYTVLEKLERPWEHSYAGELVLKIAEACPDLIKTIWKSLQESLEPRWTTKWLKAMKFSISLLNALKADCIEFGNNNFSTKQISQIITNFITPLPIMKILLNENTFEQPSVKFHVLELFLKMATTVELFLQSIEKSPNIQIKIIRLNCTDFITKNFPSVSQILNKWNEKDDDLLVSDYLNVSLDLISKYKILAPNLLDDLSLHFNFKEFLLNSDESAVKELQIKAVHLFIDLEPALFKPKTDLFKSVLCLSFEHYFNTSDVCALNVLNLLLKNSNIFDACPTEINFWINGILNLKQYDDSVVSFLCDLVRKVDDDATEYNKKLLGLEGYNFSVLLLALSDPELNVTKTLKNYLNFVILSSFHIQTNPNVFVEIISKIPFLSDKILNYFSSWSNLQITVLKHCKGKLLEQLQSFSDDFLNGYLENFKFDLYYDHHLNILQTVIFYLTNLIRANGLEENHKKNCSNFINSLTSFDDTFVETILGNSLLLKNFTPFDSSNYLTVFITDFLKNNKEKISDVYLSQTRNHMVTSILKVLKKPKYECSTFSLTTLEIVGLNYEQCIKVLTKFISCRENKTFYVIACYCLNQIADVNVNLNLVPLDEKIIHELTKIFILLHNEPNISNFSMALQKYLKTFPHQIGLISSELFETLIQINEFNKDNLSLCEFILDTTPESWDIFNNNLTDICAKRSFILFLLPLIVEKYKTDDTKLQEIYSKIESYIVKALQKPHKAGQHFQNSYKSVGLLVEKFMSVQDFGKQVQKFETTELFHVYLLKKMFYKIEKSQNSVKNVLMTFIHLLVSLLKQKSGTKPVEHLSEIGEIILDFLKSVQKCDFDLTTISGNESFKVFCKLCLKFGVVGDFILLKNLTEVVDLCVVQEDGKVIFELLLSHSQFFDVVLGNDQKNEIFELWYVLCNKWPDFMERNHIPILLSAYKGTKSDSPVLKVIKLYESCSDQTKFFDFKPFLWGNAAASHYSVRSDFQNVLWRQPKISDVLNSLNYNTIVSTITNPTDPHSYDLDFFLPLFSHLMAAENPVQTYKFTQTGALALTLTGLVGDHDQRLATCCILQRFYFHLEARQSGKDNLLWLRFIEAICKGIVVLEDFKINCFVGVFLARTALIMNQPTNVMYVPLTQYLAAKDALDFSIIPELYTFLHSRDVNSKNHKQFILEVLRDGLKSEQDFRTLLKTMGLKLISELCSSVISTSKTKLTILEVFEQCCEFDLAVKVLCGNLSFLPQIISLIFLNAQDEVILIKILSILLRIVQKDTDRHRNFLIYSNLIHLNEGYHCLQEIKILNVYYNIIALIVKRFPEFCSQDHLNLFVLKSKNTYCKNLLEYGCQFIKDDDFLSNNNDYYLRLIFYYKLKV